jgi:hypothetical protein
MIRTSVNVRFVKKADSCGAASQHLHRQDHVTLQSMAILREVSSRSVDSEHVGANSDCALENKDLVFSRRLPIYKLDLLIYDLAT